MRDLTRGVLIVLTALTGSGCAPTQSAALQSMQQVVQRMVQPSSATQQVSFDPKFQYLRIARGRQVGWMWLGSQEVGPQATTDVYYSSGGEVLRLHNGRIVGATGLLTEWRNVSLSQPSWSDIAKSTQTVSLTRLRDVMPGYRSGVRDDLTVRVIAAPRTSGLRVIDPTSLTWFEERMQESRGVVARAFLRETQDALPPARYAVDFAGGRETVVYSEQCLAPDLCFSWQRWSAAMQKKAQEARQDSVRAD